VDLPECLRIELFLHLAQRGAQIGDLGDCDHAQLRAVRYGQPF
jgi:hypothetical protein